MLVLKTTSPSVSPSAPKLLPSKVRPSASARIAFIGSIERCSLLLARQSTDVLNRIDDRIDHCLVVLALLQFVQSHAHTLIFRARYVLTDIIGFDRDFAMTRSINTAKRTDFGR